MLEPVIEKDAEAKVPATDAMLLEALEDAGKNVPLTALVTNKVVPPCWK